MTTTGRKTASRVSGPRLACKSASIINHAPLASAPKYDCSLGSLKVRRLAFILIRSDNVASLINCRLKKKGVNNGGKNQKSWKHQPGLLWKHSPQFTVRLPASALTFCRQKLLTGRHKKTTIFNILFIRLYFIQISSPRASFKSFSTAKAGRETLFVFVGLKAVRKYWNQSGNTKPCVTLKKMEELDFKHPQVTETVLSTGAFLPTFTNTRDGRS